MSWYDKKRLIFIIVCFNSLFVLFQSDSVTTDTYYQKGGIGVRLRYRDVKFAFVAAHLAAHDYFYEKRIKDYWQIIDQLRFTDMGKDKVLDHEYNYTYNFKY